MTIDARRNRPDGIGEKKPRLKGRGFFV